MRKKKISVAILGTGNIGSDLLMKVQRSELLTCCLFAGKNPASSGITRAREMGIPVSCDSIQAIIATSGKCEIVFDATSAEQHTIHAPILKRLKKFTIDMTPSKIGTLCVPVVNLREGISSWNVSMISCGGQANIPIIKAVMDLYPEISYIEVVSSISSKSAGIGTRNNIDEYTQTTSDAIVALTGVSKAKTIIILNPADPPILMHNTIYIPMKKPDLNRIIVSILRVIDKMKQYVPGFSLVLKPFYDHGRVTIMTQVVGLGDFLPVFAGNLDIINCAAIAVAEAYAKKRV
jgi:acetaldehyde dehydrogenase (acetylating)